MVCFKSEKNGENYMQIKIFVPTIIFFRENEEIWLEYLIKSYLRLDIIVIWIRFGFEIE